jgi:hypothetical protein
MLKRTKIIIACYGVAGIILLVLALVIILQMTDWLRHPEQFETFGHHHHDEEEMRPPETSPAETYASDGKTYLRAPLLNKDLDVTHSSVDLRQVLHVKLNPDTFPELTELRFIPAGEASLPDEDTILGISVEGENRAYPLRMLNYHIVLNDVCAGKEVAVVWDPLSMTPKVFDRRIEQADGSQLVLTLANLGLIHKGGLLLHDKETLSIWWPPEARSLAGSLNGRFLPERPFLLLSWAAWKQRYPASSTLSTDTPFRARYARNLYDAYYRMTDLPLPVEGWQAKDSPFRWSMPVIALEADGRAKAYPISVLFQLPGSVQDAFAGLNVTIQNPQPGPPYLTDQNGKPIRYSFGAWFLWSVRYPNIEVYRGESRKDAGDSPQKGQSSEPDEKKGGAELTRPVSREAASLLRLRHLAPSPAVALRVVQVIIILDNSVKFS